MSSATAFRNLKLATLSSGPVPYGFVEDGCIVVDEGIIQWAGAVGTCPEEYASIAFSDLGGCLVTPALIDCHSHVVFGGNRANEFEMRLNGASYQEVAEAGGGIVSTVTATRSATVEELVHSALPRIDAMIQEGVCTIEIKSGYGLDHDNEIKMLRAARRIAELRPVRVVTSYLGAHAVPKEYAGKADAYIDEVCLPTLRDAHDLGLVDAVDGFCETIAFTPKQIERVFKAAKELGLPVKLHAEQLSNLGGTQLAAEYSAISVDHIEYANEEDVKAIAASGTSAVVLPGAFYTLRETRVPPIEELRKHGVPIALATDGNPGSSPLFSPLLAMNMGCTLFGLTPEEALLGVTRNAAIALRLNDCGEIRTGLRADMAVWDVKHPAELSYRIGFNSLRGRVFGGDLEHC